MTKYQKVSPQFWSDPAVRAMDINTRYLFIYLITNSSAHYSGIYYLPKTTIKNDTGLADHPLAMGLTTLGATHRIRYDEDTYIIWIKNMLKYQLSTTNKANALKGVTKHLRSLHGSFLIGEFVEYYNSIGIEIECDYTHGMTHGVWVGQTHADYTDTDTDTNTEFMSPSVPEPPKAPINRKPKPKTFAITLNRETWKLDGTDTIKPELVARFPKIDTDAELAKVDDWCYKKQGEAIKKKDWAAFIRNWFASPYEKVLRRVDPPAPPPPLNLYEESARRASERIKAHEAKFKIPEEVQG